MKIFGYAKDNDENLLELKEVTLKVNRKDIDDVIKFLERCKEDISGDSSWEHEHMEVDGLLFGIFYAE